VVTALALLGVLCVLFVAAVLATREGGELAPAPPEVADLALPDRPLAPEDVAALRFPMAARGYRMAEVDVALERLAEELRDRDRRIGLLEAAAEGHEAGDGQLLPVPSDQALLDEARPAAAGPVRQATPDDLPLPPASSVPDPGPAGAPPQTAGH